MTILGQTFEFLVRQGHIGSGRRCPQLGPFLRPHIVHVSPVDPEEDKRADRNDGNNPHGRRRSVLWLFESLHERGEMCLQGIGFQFLPMLRFHAAELLVEWISGRTVMASDSAPLLMRQLTWMI